MPNVIGNSQNAKPGGPGCKGRVSRHNKGTGSKAKGKTFLYKSYLERAAWSFSKFVSSRKLRSDTACVKICTNDLWLVQWFTRATQTQRLAKVQAQEMFTQVQGRRKNSAIHMLV